MGGGIPIYLSTDRNAYGLIGPIRPEELDEKSIRARIRANPLVKDTDAWQRERPFRAAVIEQCTYDGTIYDAERIVGRIGRLCDYILFDEAGRLHEVSPALRAPLRDGPDRSWQIVARNVATQSAHKQLASFSQASQIHVRDRHIKGQRRRVEHRRFNEGFMQHASTSPFYPLFASLDVGAQMMKGRSGEVYGTTRSGSESNCARNCARSGASSRRRRGTRRGAGSSIRSCRSASRSRRGARAHNSRSALGKRVERSHRPRSSLLGACAGRALARLRIARRGFRHHRSGQLTLLTRVSMRDRRIRSPRRAGAGGRPYLRERRVVPEKNDLNSLLFLLTPGVEFEQGRHPRFGACRLRAAARRQRAARRRDAGIRRQTASALSWPGSRTCVAKCTRFSATPASANPRRRNSRPSISGHGHDAPGSVAPPRAQQRRLRAARGAGRPRRDNLVRSVSARNRDHGSPGERLTERARLFDQVSQDVSEEAPTCFRNSKPKFQASIAK